MANYLRNTIRGRIPSCIFQLPNIESIYLAANALTGSIPDDILISSSHLVNISISYNRLSGTIPRQLMHSKLTVLDVSNNKLTGTLEDGITDFRYTKNNEYTDTIIKLHLNRFSGKAPGATASSYDKVEVMRGNQFSCDILEIESKDPAAKSQLCGSDNLNLSIYLLSAVIVIAIILSIFVTRATREMFVSREDLVSENTSFNLIRFVFKKLHYWSEWYSELRDIESSEVASTVFCIRFMKYLGLSVTAFVIVLSCIVYPLLKTNINYKLIYIQYNWLISGAFLIGLLPSIVLYLMWLVVIVFVAVHISSFCCLRDTLIDIDGSTVSPTREGELSRNPTDSDTINISSKTKSEQPSSMLQRFLMYSKKFYSLGAKLLLLNLVVSLGINMAFVYSVIVIKNEFITNIVRFIFAAVKLYFDMVPGTLLVKYYQLQLSGNKTDIKGGRLKLLFLVFNGIICPIIATFFLSNRCFRSKILGENPITVAHEVLFCSDEFFSSATSSTSCLSYSTTVQEAQFEPPFLYSNQCISSLQVHFIPITIIGVIMKAMVYPIYFLNMKYILKVKDMIFAQSTFKDSVVDQEMIEGRYFLRNRFLTYLLVSQMHNITLLLSLGLLSPPLATAIGIAIVSETYFSEMKIGQQLHRVKNGRLVLGKSDLKCIDSLWKFPKESIGIVFSVSAVIIAFGVFDMSSDELGLTAGLLMILVTLISAFTMWFLVRKTNILSAYHDRLYVIDIAMRRNSTSLSSLFTKSSSSVDAFSTEVHRKAVFSRGSLRKSQYEMRGSVLTTASTRTDIENSSSGTVSGEVSKTVDYGFPKNEENDTNIMVAEDKTVVVENPLQNEVDGGVNLKENQLPTSSVP